MTAPIREAVAAALGKRADEVSLVLRPAPNFQSNRLYDAHVGHRHLIVKEFLKPDEFDQAPLREFKGLQLVAPLDIAPQPLFRRAHSPGRRPLVAYEFMAGEMWDRRQPNAAELADLAALWQDINDVSVAGLWHSRGYERSLVSQMARFGRSFRRYGEWAEADFPAGVVAAEHCLSLLAQRAPVIQQLATAQSPLCFCRADARFANVIARPDGRLGMVDWEDCGLRDPALDLADVVTAPNQEDLLSWHAWQPFLHPYLTARAGGDPGLERRLHLYLALFPLVWLGILLEAGLKRATEGGLASWLIHRLPANERLRRYLARASAWPALDFQDRLGGLAEMQFFPEERDKMERT